VIGAVCVFVCVWRAGGVCYHDNSKLRASIFFTKLGLWVKVVTVSSWLNFGRPPPPGRGSTAGRNFFGSALLRQARSVCVSPSAFLIVVVVVENAIFVSVCIKESEMLRRWRTCVFVCDYYRISNSSPAYLIAGRYVSLECIIRILQSKPIFQLLLLLIRTCERSVSGQFAAQRSSLFLWHPLSAPLPLRGLPLHDPLPLKRFLECPLTAPLPLSPFSCPLRSALTCAGR